MQSKLQRVIIERGYRNQQVAERCGFSPVRISEYIHEAKPIPPQHLIILCQILKCNPNDIIGYEPFLDFSVAK